MSERSERVNEPPAVSRAQDGPEFDSNETRPRGDHLRPLQLSASIPVLRECGGVWSGPELRQKGPKAKTGSGLRPILDLNLRFRPQDPVIRRLDFTLPAEQTIPDHGQ